VYKTLTSNAAAVCRVVVGVARARSAACRVQDAFVRVCRAGSPGACLQASLTFCSSHIQFDCTRQRHVLLMLDGRWGKHDLMFV